MTVRLMTVRVRLAAACTGLLIAAGAGLIALVYVLLRGSLASGVRPVLTARSNGARITLRPDTVHAVQDATLQRLLISSLAALAVFAVLSAVLAWWFSARLLRPVHEITATARRLNAENLHERLATRGPRDELKELAATFDAMLDRLAAVVGAQRRFIANAAHELRTPLAMQRAAVEIGLHEADPARVEDIRGEMLTVLDRSERLIEGLLLLSTTDRGLNATRTCASPRSWRPFWPSRTPH
jgi:signal transduction histidine kinase